MASWKPLGADLYVNLRGILWLGAHLYVNLRGILWLGAHLYVNLRGILCRFTACENRFFESLLKSFHFKGKNVHFNTFSGLASPKLFREPWKSFYLKFTWDPMGWSSFKGKFTWDPMAWTSFVRKFTWDPMAWSSFVRKFTWDPMAWC